MTDPTGWPDPSKPGVPLNPDKDGWHWIEPKFGPKAMWPVYWCARNGGYWNWQSDDACDLREYAEHMQDGSWKYRGPCLTPQEIAAALAQARRDALEEAAKIADAQGTEWAQDGRYKSWDAADVIAAAIRAKAQEGRDV
jgi:hypothetical protein